MSSKTKTTATKEEATPALVPKLRFPEFRGAEAWKPKTLADICLLITNGKANAQDHEEDGEYPLFDRSAVIKKSSEFMFDAEAVILPGEGMRFVPKYFRGKFNLHQRAYALMRHQGDGRFVYHSLDYFQDTLAEKAVKSTVLSLRLPIVENFVIGCPTSAEQQKIASCLSSVDELMAAQARKVEALKTHKKGLMQQLFPREGETQPRLRFPEFQNAGEWEVKRVDEQGSVLAGKALAVDAPGPQRPYLRTKNVLDGAIDLSDVLTMPMTDAEFARFEILNGDVLLNEGQSLELVGRASIYRGEFGQRCAMQNALLRFRAFPSNSAEFAAQYFRQCQKDGTFANVATKTTSVAHLGSSRFSALELSWPSPAEQQRIATCLSSLDALITAETQKHEALKTHKKGLMQQLFPSPEDR